MRCFRQIPALLNLIINLVLQMWRKRQLITLITFGLFKVAVRVLLTDAGSPEDLPLKL